jgi:hypothetical protein
MGEKHVPTGRRVGLVEITRIAQWWTQAPQEERFRLFARSIRGEEGSPPLRDLQVAITLAEIEAGEISQG